MTRLTRQERDLARAFRDAVDALTAAVEASPEVASALRVGNATQLDAALPLDVFEQHFLNSAPEILLRGMVSGGRRAFADAPVAKAAASAGWRLNVTDPRMARWAKDRSAKLITHISESVRTAVRSAVGSAFGQQMTVRELARLVGPMVGPLPRESTSLLSSYFDTRRSLVESGLSDRAADARAVALAERLSSQAVSRRGETIARTEIMAAQNAGRMEGWQQAYSDGLIDERALKTWNAVDPCDECDELDGEEVPFLESFSNGDDMPPAHPNCKCSVTLDSDPSLQPRDQPSTEGDVTDGETTPGYSSATTDNPDDLNFDKFDGSESSSLNGLEVVDGSTYADTILDSIWEQQGFHGLPEMVDDLPGKGPQIWRGVGSRTTVTDDAARALADSFREGPHQFPGTGINGNGSYFTLDYSEGLNYANQRASGLIEAELRSEAKVVNLDDIRARRDHWWDTKTAEIGKLPIGKQRALTDERNRLWNLYVYDLGRYASSLGFDAIKVDRGSWGDHYVILNRTALYVKRVV